MRILTPFAFVLLTSVIPVGGTAAAQTAGAQESVLPPSDTLPAMVVQRFVDAANTRDAAAMALLVAPAAIFATFPDNQVIAENRDNIHALFADLMPTASPGSHVTVENRIVAGHFVIDQEFTTGVAAEDEHSTWIYEVLGGLIHRMWVLVGPPAEVP